MAENISSFMDTFSVLVILLIGALMVANNDIGAGSVAAMVGYFGVFYSLLADFGFIIKKIPILKNLSNRMEVLYSDTEDLSGIEIKNYSDLSANDLCFDYDGIDVFSNLNFNIKENDKTLICGANGSGKSTLIKIICGLLKGYKGSLKINGREFRDISIKSWRCQFAYAAQDPYLFAGTVKENIHLGNLAASDSEVCKVMHKVGISYLADKEISMDNNDLSEGEKQKISIARALLKKFAGSYFR